MKLQDGLAIAIYVAIYAASVLHLSRIGSFPVEEALTILVILGLIFPAIAWIVTIRHTPMEVQVDRPASQAAVALALVAGFGIYLVFMRSWADDLVPIGAAGANGAMHLAWVLALKLATMVALPFLLMNSLFHVRLKDFGLSIEGLRRLAGRDGLTVLVLSAALCGFQYLAGSAAAPFREGRYPSEALQVGLPFAFAWLVLEVGLTEEFLFRGLLQHRLSAFLRSDVAGMLLMAIVFGLVHAPGIVLRGAGVAEGLGEHPDVLTAMAYTIAVQSVVAILFAVVWMRTRNLAVVILIHAATDLLSNATEVMSAFGFVTLAP